MLNTGHLEGRQENISFIDIIPLLKQRDKYLLTATLKLVNKSQKGLLQEKIITHKGKPIYSSGIFFWVVGQGKISNIEFVPKHTQRP